MFLAKVSPFSLREEKTFNFDKFNVSIFFSLMDCAFGVKYNNSLPRYNPGNSLLFLK